MTMRIVTNNQKIISFACQKLTSFLRFPVIRFKEHSFYRHLRFLPAGLLILLYSCKGGIQADQETPTRGNIRITADESFKPLIDSEVFAFTHLYTNAKIKAQYKPEFDVINDFMNDSVKVIVTSKKLTEDQIRYLRDTLVVARTVTVAYDALALVINRNNYDTLLKYDDIKDIFLGKKKTWKELDPKSKLGNIRVIFDNTKSGNIRYFKELYDIHENLPENFFAVNNNEEVVNFVSRNSDALGIISVNWISDKDDSTGMGWVKKVRVVGVSKPFFNDNTYYRPDQGWIYDRSYPFVREIYLISRESFTGLGSGFIQWVASDRGQTIVLKSGLVPATMPIRLVQVKK
ncbi:MAG: Phosphate-binding protein PstS precursor [Bacteroidetes bacterium ADurb.Bin145]|nr:MAG: Phosphate-binding protein PstS precursor [Bacteroidetes bacterium ADurb.Bin145]